MLDTMFHIPTKQQAKLKFLIFNFLRFYIADEKTKHSKLFTIWGSDTGGYEEYLFRWKSTDVSE
jgi:hypothetical protein